MNKVVAPYHKETAIVFVGPPKLLLGLVSPFGRLVTPRSVPLSTTTRVSQFDESHRLAIKLDSVGRDKGVSVTINDTIILLLFIGCARLRSTALRKVGHVATLEPLKNIFSIEITMIHDFLRLTSHNIKKVTFVATPSALITAHKLSPGFLKESHPELASLKSGKFRAGIIFVHEEVINDHEFCHSVDVNYDAVDTAVVSSSVDEAVTYKIGELSIG